MLVKEALDDPPCHPVSVATEACRVHDPALPGNLSHQYTIRVSQPALTKHWSQTSLFFLEHGRTNEAFLQAWVSREAHTERVGLVGLTRQWLSITQAHETLLKRRGGRGRTLEQVLGRLFTKPPPSPPDRAGRVWRGKQGEPKKLEAATAGVNLCKDRRNGLVCGSRTAHPRLAEACVWLIRDAVIGDEVFAGVAGPCHS